MLRALAALLTAALALFAFILHTPPPWTLDVGASGDERSLRGWHERERGDGLSFRWSRPGSLLVLHGADARAYVLVLRVNPGADASRVHLVSRSRPLAAFDAAPGWTEKRIPIALPSPAGVFPDSPTVEVVCDRYLTAHDGRALGLMVDRVLLEPDPQGIASFTGPLGRGLAWTLLLAALATVLARLRRGGSAGAPAASWLLLAPVSCAAAALAWAAQRDPYLMAWALPPMPWTLGVVALGLLVTRRRATAPGPKEAEAGETPRPWRWAPAFLLSALALALAMRLVAIEELPWALWRDEARHGVFALQILEEGACPPIWGHHVNLPALGLYPFALALKVWGLHTWSLRTVTGLAGALTVLPLYGLAYRLTRRRDVGLMAAALLAVSSWHVSVSRFSFPTVFDPFLTLTGLWLLLRARDAGSETRRAGWAAAAGIALGLAMQTYHSARVAPLLAAALVFWIGRPVRRASIVVPLVLAFAVVIAPLALYAVAHPAATNDRVGKVFLLRHAARGGEAPLAALDASLGRHLLMFHWRGDDNGRHHAPGKPLLDGMTGLAFLAGLALLLKRWRTDASRFLLVALAVAIAPSLLAVDGPHAMRSIGAAAFACLIAAKGALALARSTPWPRACALATVGLALVLNATTYFVTMPVDPRVWGASDAVPTQVGDFVRHRAAHHGSAAVERIFVSEEVARSDVFGYLTHGTDPARFDAQTLSRAARPGDLFVLSGDSHAKEARALARYLGPHPAPAALGPPFPGLTVPSFVVYEVPAP